MRRDLHVTHNRFPKAIPRGHLDKVSRWLQNDEFGRIPNAKMPVAPDDLEAFKRALIDKRERPDSTTHWRWRLSDLRLGAHLADSVAGDTSEVAEPKRGE